MAVFKGDEESAEVSPANEGAAREDQGDEADRSTAERVAEGTVAIDEGRKPFGRLPAPPHPNALSVCFVSSDNHLS